MWEIFIQNDGCHLFAFFSHLKIACFISSLESVSYLGIAVKQMGLPKVTLQMRGPKQGSGKKGIHRYI